MTTELYRRLVEQSPDGIVISQDGLLVFVNTAAGRLCGAAEPDELLGRSLSDLFNSDPLSDGHESRRRRLEQLMAGQAVASFEEQIVRLDGGLTDVEVALTRLDLPRSSSPGWSLPRRTSGGASRARCTISSASS